MATKIDKDGIYRLTNKRWAVNLKTNLDSEWRVKSIKEHVVTLKREDKKELVSIDEAAMMLAFTKVG